MSKKDDHAHQLKAATMERLVEAMAKVTCCPYGKCRHSVCRSGRYRVSAKTKVEGLRRLGFRLKQKPQV